MAYISNAEKFGMEKGIKKGKLEVAEHLLEEGLKLALIKKTTGLSLAKLKELQQKLKQTKKH
jgi:predicted transposase/invertase (TIGR01784 family)